MPRYTGRLVPSPLLPAALSSVQLILHGDGVLEQAVDALEVHAAVRHVLYGTESREGVEGGGLVNISPCGVVLEPPCLGREDREEETSALGSALQLQPLNRLWVDLLQEIWQLCNAHTIWDERAPHQSEAPEVRRALPAP